MELSENNTKNLSLNITDRNLAPISYAKTDKLITALFMVTDIMDKDENIKIKLRDIGLSILSDIHLNSFNIKQSYVLLLKKINLIDNLLDIAKELNIMSVMNNSILKKEFKNLKNSIENALDKNFSLEENILNDLLKDESILKDNPSQKMFEILPTYFEPKPNRQNPNLLNGQKPTNIGLQTPSTLMNALEKLKNTKPAQITKNIKKNNYNSYDKNKDNSSKNSRREELVKILKSNSKGLTISEIKNVSNGQIATLGEKTLQRELVAMVKDNILYKTGSKRWSKYFLNK